MPGIDFGLDRFGRRDPDPVMTVTQLTAAVKSAITSMPELSHVAVAGEISSCTRSAKGHIYITLKDGASVVSAVVFAGSARTLTHQPQVNEQVVCYGSVDVYGGQGRYQLYCTDITLQGAGTQAAELEALRRRLEQEGLFSQHRPIPAMPRIIAVVTSAGGAALTDIKNCPMVKLLLIPALVQGAEAPESVAAGIRRAQDTDADVIIFGRGGGSVEDLSCFNSEVIARAVYASRIPTISAVGHERDYSICDYAADLRAPTPSAAAELAVFDVQLVEKWLMDYGTQMRRQLELKLNQMRTRLMHDEEKLRYLNPRAKLKENEKRLDELGAALERRMQATLEQKRHTLALLSGRLDGMSPLKKLAQGYSYVEDAGGHALTDADTVQIGEALSIHLYRGSLKAAVTEIRKQDAAEDGLEKGRIDG